MSDQTPPPPQPLWLRLVNNQHFKLLIAYLVKASGVATIPFMHNWFPDLTPDALATYIVAAIPASVVFVIDWWRNTPNNIIRRALMVLNGPPATTAKVTEQAKADIVETVAQTVPGVKVKVDPVVASAAVVEMAKSKDNDVKMDKAA